jgi:HSP20 family molecular chaperone IbpA
MLQLNHLNFQEESLVYPGVYIPCNNEPEHSSGVKKAAGKKFPSTKVKELMGSYLVETSLPAAKREDFLVRAYGNQIYIDARLKASGINDTEYNQNEESPFLHFTRKVVLPEDADTGFVSAEYSSGVLRFHIPKISHPVTPRQSIIVIY